MTLDSATAFRDDKIWVLQGDCREIASLLAADGVKVDAVDCDPPYHLTSIVKRFGGEGAARAKDRDGAFARQSAGFMGQTWDGGDVAFRRETWEAIGALLKPGGHLTAFSGTRTYHRMAAAIEDAGFEIRDQLAWVYGSGFPKSHDVSKGIDRMAGAERQVIVQGQTVRRMIPGADQNRQGWEKNDGRTFTPSITMPVTKAARDWEGWGTALKPAWEPICLGRKPMCGTVAENILAHGNGAINVDACRVGHREARALNRNHGGGIGNDGHKGGQSVMDGGQGRWPANIMHDGSDDVLSQFPDLETARFFYTAKADADDRLGSRHPTVKPLDLMCWVVRLTCRKGALVLDPFAGSGTTGIAALTEGCRAILIEREEKFVADILARIEHFNGHGRHSGALKARRRDQAGNDGPLFGTAAE
jgi:DNA modification methylase